MMHSRSCPRLPNLRHWLGSLNGGRQGAAVLTITIDVLVSSFLSSNVSNVSTGTELGKFKFNIVKNKSLDDRNVCSHKKKNAEGIRVGMVGHACKHDQKVRLPVVWFQIYQAECRCRSECMCDLCRVFASTIRADHGIRLGYALCDVHVLRIELEDWFSFVGYVAPIFDAVLV